MTYSNNKSAKKQYHCSFCNTNDTHDKDHCKLNFLHKYCIQNNIKKSDINADTDLCFDCYRKNWMDYMKNPNDAKIINTLAKKCIHNYKQCQSQKYSNISSTHNIHKYKNERGQKKSTKIIIEPQSENIKPINTFNNKFPPNKNNLSSQLFSDDDSTSNIMSDDDNFTLKPMSEDNNSNDTSKTSQDDSASIATNEDDNIICVDCRSNNKFCRSCSYDGDDFQSNYKFFRSYDGDGDDLDIEEILEEFVNKFEWT